VLLTLGHGGGKSYPLHSKERDSGSSPRCAGSRIFIKAPLSADSKAMGRNGAEGHSGENAELPGEEVPRPPGARKLRKSILGKVIGSKSRGQSFKPTFESVFFFGFKGEFPSKGAALIDKGKPD